jgi:hypothetical protein
MQQPVPDVLGLTKFHLRQFCRVGETQGLDLYRPLANLGFVPVPAEHILHKSSDIVCHVGLPRLTFIQVYGVKSMAYEAVWFDVSQSMGNRHRSFTPARRLHESDSDQQHGKKQ